MVKFGCVSVAVVMMMVIARQGALGIDCESHGNGCRAPFGLDVAYENLFSPACKLHSVCYSCGADSSLTKGDCDSALQTAMHAACDTLSQPDLCRFHGDNVFVLQTKVVGTIFFHHQGHTEPFCVEHGIEGCLPLNVSTTTASPAVVG